MTAGHTATNGRRRVRPFNPSNLPDTCLYCGVALPEHPGKEYTHKNTVSLCCRGAVARAMEPDSSTLANWRSVMRCSICRRELVGDADDIETVETVSVFGRSDTRGYDGDFCTLDCGYRFGVLAASKGVRYRQLAPTEETPT